MLSSREMPTPKTEADLRRFIIALGDNAERATVLREAVFGKSSLTVDAIKKMRETGFAESISELAISGTDLIPLGIVGKDIGKTLSALFEAVTDDPTRNNKEYLIKYARTLNNK